MSEPHISTILRGAILGIAYLHTAHKIHRDIKAGNILLDTRGNPKLADLGVVGDAGDVKTKRLTVRIS